MPKSYAVRESILKGEYNALFSKLYDPSEDTIQKQINRYAHAITRFEETYGESEITIYSTPGRTEISGNHTDHNHGVVMAAAVTLDIIAIVSQNKDNFVRVTSEGFGAPDIVDLSYLAPVTQEYGHSSALVRGVSSAIKERGGTIAGLNIYTTSDVLRGSGLSSSAAFEVCIATIMNNEYNSGKFSAVDLAIISQYAENKFFGKPSGLMDQTACSVGNVITIDFKDPQNPIVEELPLQLSEYGYQLIITDTKGSHANLTDEYASIRREMESVASYFGKHSLREVSYTDVLNNIPALRKKEGDRAVLRAIHFFEECKRVEKLKKSIYKKDFETFKSIIIASGHSSFEYNQNAYSSRHPQEQGVSLGIAISQLILDGSGAWRLQGGGFAGTIQAFVPKTQVDEYCKNLNNIFGENSCYVLDIRNTGSTIVSI